MARWLTYLHERFPFGVYLVLSLGFAVSGQLLASPNEGGLWKPITFSVFGLLLFFGELRLMDEFKDYAKDLVAHPERPLPRKLLSLSEVRIAIYGLFFLMLTVSVLAGCFFNPIAGTLYFGFTFYLGLMFKEFYLGETLAKSPLLYAITHQVILIPICLFTVAVTSEPAVKSPSSFAYAVTVLGAFFGYEVSRKLDPHAHPILKTYLSHYGVTKTILLMISLLSIAALGAWNFGAESFLWPIEALMMVSLSLMVVQPSAFRWIEWVASVSLILHIWSVPIQLYLLRK